MIICDLISVKGKIVPREYVMEAKSPQVILTLEQAAEYLQLTPEELQVELEQKRIPGLLIAGKWRVKKDVIDRLLEGFFSGGSQQPTTESENRAEARLGPSGIPEAGDHHRDERVDKQNESIVRSPNLPEVSEVFAVSKEPIPLTPPQGRVWGRVHVRNVDKGYAYARLLLDNRVVWLPAKNFENPDRLPYPGEIVEMQLYNDARKGLSGRLLKIVKPLGYSVGTETVNRSPQNLSVASAERNPEWLTTPRSEERRRQASHHVVGSPRGTVQAQQIYQKAALALTEGRDNDARRLFRQAIDAGGGVDVYTAFFKMESSRGNRIEAARKIIQEAVAKFPDHAVFYDMYGQMERRARNYRVAEEVFRRGLSRFSTNAQLSRGLAQTLVQIGTEAALAEAGRIYERLERLGRANTSDRFYQRYKALQRSPVANRAYEFFQQAGMRVGIAGRRDLPQHATDLVVETNDQTLGEAFGLTGAFLIRCFHRKVEPIDILNVSRFLREMGSESTIGLQEGREVVLNPSLAFIAVPNSDVVRDQVMSILGENREAIVPLDDFVFSNSEDPHRVLRDLLGQYLGHRDLYASTLPVSGRRFFGRDRLLYQLTDEIHRGQFLGIYGLRKMGKTSLIYQLRDEKLQGEAVAYADLQASHALVTRNLDPLYWELERDLFERLVNHSPEAANELRLGKVTRFSDLPNVEGQARLLFSEDIRALLEMIVAGKIPGVRRLIIVLDELERILPISEQTRIDGYLEFFGLLRGLAQNERYRNIISSVVVAANAAISDRGYWEGRENPVFALYKSVPLPPFSEEECREMIVSLGKGMSVYWEQDAIRMIFAETGGHPFLTRAVCSQITKHHPVRPLTVTIELVQQQVIEFIRSEGDKLEQIIELLRTNFPEEERLLEMIAYGDIPSGISDESLRHLLSYYLVRAEHDGYVITLNLLRRWLRRRAGIKEQM